MGKPSLREMAKSDRTARIYRYPQLPSFSSAVATRSEIRAEGSGMVYVTELDGAGGCEPGKPKMKKTIMLSAEQVRQLVAVLDRIDFWSDRVAIETPSACLDGTQYVMEALDRGRYKFVARHNCALGDEMFRVMATFAELSGTRPPVKSDH